MARSKNPHRYPLFCFAVADKLERTQTKPTVMHCDSLREARGLALTFNCWKGAALDAQMEDRFSTLKDMVARAKDDPPRCEFRNINTDPNVARWNKELGLPYLLEDEDDPPAYTNR